MEIVCDVNQLNEAEVALEVAMTIQAEVPGRILKDENGEVNLAQACQDEVYGDVLSKVVAAKLAEHVTKLYNPEQKTDVYFYNMTDRVITYLSQYLPGANMTIEE